MTPLQAKELLPIITAFAEGKTVQVNDDTGWSDRKTIYWDYTPSSYRIKPEPREFWIVEYVPNMFTTWTRKNIPKEYLDNTRIHFPSIKIIHVKEVI